MKNFGCALTIAFVLACSQATAQDFSYNWAGTANTTTVGKAFNISVTASN